MRFPLLQILQIDEWLAIPKNLPPRDNTPKVEHKTFGVQF